MYGIKSDNRGEAQGLSAFNGGRQCPGGVEDLWKNIFLWDLLTVAASWIIILH